MVDPDALIAISALQHFIYCPRQCALIHVEQVWDENLYTLRGQRVHEQVVIAEGDSEEGVRIERALPLWSHRLGLTGIGDVVEFSQEGPPYPVEYKAGSRKIRLADEVQLCAQGMCLEEMLGVVVPKGALFHHRSRRRREVLFTDTLRQTVMDAIQGVRELLQNAILPSPVADSRCTDCSLLEACMPYALRDFQHRATDPFTLTDL